AISLFFFAMSTIVGWYFFAAQNVRFLFGERPIIAYRVIVMVLVVVASVIKVELVWELADTFNFFIVIPNVIALIWLSSKVVAESDKMKKEIFLIKKKRDAHR
ncbi:MAG: alanine:cation symporter family protein, partial [Prevotella sp.]